MSKPVAAIDLGTNTFHLLIAGKGPDGYFESVRRVDAVKLGEGGITKGIIAEAAFERGIEMLRTYAAICDAHGVHEIRAIATSAVRNAGNGAEFARQVLAQTGIAITIVDGEQEAAYIYDGIKASGSLSHEPALIVDIGGGSVEFIICTDTSIAWKRSFEVGAARLTAAYQQVDPIPAATLHRLENYLADTLVPLFEAADEFGVKRMIGSAGAFETFAALIDPAFDVENAIRFDFRETELINILDRLIGSSHEQRLATGRIIPVRIDMIVPAAVITRFLLRRLAIRQAAMTTYSLKEGVVARLVG